MPFYKFDYEYIARGSRIVEFEDDEEAKEFGWSDRADDLIDSWYDYDWDIDTDDVEITEVDENGNDIRTIYED